MKPWIPEKKKKEIEILLESKKKRTNKSFLPLYS